VTLRIEPMAESDLLAVLAIEQSVAVVPWTAGQFADSLRAGYSAWVGRSAEKTSGNVVSGVAGFALWMQGGDEAHLLNIGVGRDWQGRGYGAQLLRHVIGGARRAGATSMFLEVRPSNLPALHLYRSFGFAEVGRRKAYYPAPPPQPREDALVLRLGLDGVDGGCDGTR
jgi:[ribosomal protein S18]-alanine N-acetyltransferase